jgi:hypothetical protein
VDARLQRIAKNEEVYRAANREIADAEEKAGAAADGVIEVICECGRDSCNGVIRLTVADYSEAHGQKDRFVVLRGHETQLIERVVDDRGNYLVVDKVGEAEEIVEDDSR